ncbi:hypothetical protein ACIQXD_33170 [Streptomyces uncialis]|uniref:hypothetical protein n=1 Tax=Streptomyces uncialis TaxID=1048205 RepID=UPI0038049D5C
MTRLEAILSRALLVRDHEAPADIVPPTGTRPRPDSPLPDTDAPPPHPAAEDLRLLCETLLAHIPTTTAAEFVTEQVPEPRGALVLACVLQLTRTDDGARFWWQYAAGAGQAAAAYCLYLHHLSLGEDDTAHWWHGQTDDTGPEPRTHAQEPHSITDASTTTVLRVLNHLAKDTPRTRTAAVTDLMDYLPTAVATAYLRQPDVELPLPGNDFAHRIRALLRLSAGRPRLPANLPARPGRRTRTRTETVTTRYADRTGHHQMDRTATH